jgi:hypothetical protein
VTVSLTLTVALDQWERFADEADRVSAKNRQRHFERVVRPTLQSYRVGGVGDSASSLLRAAFAGVGYRRIRELVLERSPDRPGAERWMAGVLQDILGNPEYPLSPAWRTSTAVTLAGRMYDVSTFDRMPILADALEDAGCDAADVLAHCREPEQVHVRGCWVVDLVLGKG